MNRLVMHVTTMGTPHRVRCGADGRKAHGSWPSRVRGMRPEPPYMASWLEAEGWRWCASCVKLTARDDRRDASILEIERLKNRMALRDSALKIGNSEC